MKFYLLYCLTHNPYPSSYPDNILHDGVAKHPVEFDLFILQHVLQASFRTVLGDDALVRGVDTCPDKPDDVVVLEVFDLVRGGGEGVSQ